MRRNLAFIIAILVCVYAFPAFAQSEGEFFHALQGNLPRSTSTQNAPVPQPGTAERVLVSSTPDVDVTSSYQAYDAGQDKMSGYLAAGGAILAALVVAFALGFILTHRHSSSED